MRVTVTVLLVTASVAACGGLIAPVEDAGMDAQPAPGEGAADASLAPRTDASPRADAPPVLSPRDDDAGTALTGADASIEVDASLAVDASVDGATAPAIPNDLLLVSTASAANDVLLVTATPMFFALDATHVYWTDWHWQANSIQRVSKQGGPIEILAPATRPMGIATDGTNVYWADSSSIRSTPVSGGPVTVLVTDQTPLSLVKTDDALYWTNSASGGSVMKSSLDGSNAHAIATCIAGERPLDVAVNGNVVTWSTDEYRVMTSGLEGENPRTLLTMTDVFGVSTDGSSVFFIEEGGFGTGYLRSIGASGSPSVTLATARDGGCRGRVALDDDFLWVAWCMQPGLVKRSRTTGAATALGISADDVVVDATDVYWMESVGGVLTYIKKRPK